MTTLQEPPTPVDRSKYSTIFAELQAGEHHGQWIELDTVKGGGLRSRIEAGRYVGLRGLAVEVRAHRTDGKQWRVFIRVTGREDST